MDDSEVALGAGEDLKQNLPNILNACEADARHRHMCMLGVDTTADEDEARNTDQLDKNRVVGKEVAMANGCVGALLAPSLETHKQDVDVNWEEEEDMCDGEDCGDDDA